MPPRGRARPRGLSVVIPNWNHRAYLPRAIRSARAAVAAVEAMGLPGEVLVIDDGSRDGSTRLLRSLAGLYGWNDVATLFLRQDVGLVGVRNIGLRNAEFSPYAVPRRGQRGAARWRRHPSASRPRDPWSHVLRESHRRE